MHRCILLAVGLLLLCACGDDEELPCDELAAICASCAGSDSEQLTAKRSCELTAERGAEIDCQARLDERTYEKYACQHP